MAETADAATVLRPLKPGVGAYEVVACHCTQGEQGS